MLGLGFRIQGFDWGSGKRCIQKCIGFRSGVLNEVPVIYCFSFRFASTLYHLYLIAWV